MFEYRNFIIITVPRWTVKVGLNKLTLLSYRIGYKSLYFLMNDRLNKLLLLNK